VGDEGDGLVGEAFGLLVYFDCLDDFDDLDGFLVGRGAGPLGVPGSSGSGNVGLIVGSAVCLLGLFVGTLVGRLVGSLVELPPPTSNGAFVGEGVTVALNGFNVGEFVGFFDGAEVGDGVDNGIAGDVKVMVELVAVRFWFTASKFSFIVSVNSVRLSGVMVTEKVIFDVRSRSSSLTTCVLLRAPQG
jgi:hypothetical protein